MASCVLVFAAVWTACGSDSPAGPTPPPSPIDVTLTATARGSVRADGIVDTDASVGDGALNRAHQAFLAFDFTTIFQGVRSDSDGEVDQVRFGTPRLVVTYTGP